MFYHCQRKKMLFLTEEKCLSAYVCLFFFLHVYVRGGGEVESYNIQVTIIILYAFIFGLYKYCKIIRDEMKIQKRIFRKNRILLNVYYFLK